MNSRKFKNITGMILGSKDVGDYDKVFAVFSPELGKIHLIGYGANRFKSRFSNKSNTSNIIRCLVRYLNSVEKMPSIEEIELIADFFSLFRGNILKMAIISSITEIINLTVPLEVFDEKVYSLSLKAFYSLANSECEVKSINILMEFLLKIVKNLGILPYIKDQILSTQVKSLFISIIKNQTDRVLCNLSYDEMVEALDWIENKIKSVMPIKKIISFAILKEIRAKA